MIEFPKITVVTPCFNMADFLESTIQSVLGQSYPNLEYIIIDGGSTDGSVEIIKKYESKLSFWISEKDNGMYHAIQKGFDHSTGEIMCWLNADDLALPNSLQSVAKIFSKHSSCHWIEGNNVICDEQGTLINSRMPENHTRYFFLMNRHLSDDAKSLRSFSTIQQESTFWRRSLWKLAGSKLSTDLKYGGDFELWIRFFRYAELYTTHTQLSAFRIRQDQNSARFRSVYMEEIKEVIAGELKLLSSEDKKIMSFIRRVDRFPFLMKSSKVKNKYMHYTHNISLSF